MKNKNIDFRFKVPSEYFMNRKSQKIEYATKKEQHIGIVRINYDIEEKEEEEEEEEIELSI